MNKYTPEALQYVMENIRTQSHKEMADHLGVGSNALKKQIWLWRKEGHAIPLKKQVPIGTKAIRNCRGLLREFVKTESGWKCTHVPRLPARAMINKPLPNHNKMKFLKGAKRIPKRVKMFTTRKVDLKSRVPVYIPELRMTVFVKPDANVADVRRKYIEQRDFNFQKVS